MHDRPLTPHLPARSPGRRKRTGQSRLMGLLLRYLSVSRVSTRVGMSCAMMVWASTLCWPAPVLAQATGSPVSPSAGVAGTDEPRETESPRLLRRTQPRWDLLLMKTSTGDQSVTSIEQWEVRRAGIVQAMQAVMGDLPGDERRCPLDVSVDEVELIADIARLHLTYQSEAGGFVPAYLFVLVSSLDELPFEMELTDEQRERTRDSAASRQGDATRRPAMLCLHPTDQVRGNRGVIGIPERPTMGYALELARRGYVTLAPAYPLLADYQPDLAALGWESGSMKAIWDNVRGLDLLTSLPCVDPDRMGAIGHSLGGHNAVYTAVLEPRIKVVVTSCGLDAYVDYYDGREDVWRPGAGWCQERYIPRLAQYADDLESIPYDFPELIGALAPRRVLIVAPVGDDNFRAASVDRIATSARQVYRLWERESSLEVLHPPGPHDFSDDMRKAAYEWIDESW